jgi:hypothetical protein
MKARYADGKRLTIADRRTAGLIAPLVFGAIHCGPASAATLPVKNCNDAGEGSLRAVIAAASSGDIVDLTALTCSSISLSTGELLIEATDLTVRGPGADNLTISGGPQPSHDYSVIDHSGTGTLRVESLRLTDANAYMYYDACIHSIGSVDIERSIVTNCSGGGVYAKTGATVRYSTISDSKMGIDVGAGNVVIRNSTIANNSAWACAGVRLGRVNRTGSVEISGSTLSGNRSVTYGGGAGCIFLPATIVNSTIVHNAGNDGTPGLVVNKAPLTLESTILANNAALFNHNDLSVYSGAVSGHNNLVMQASNSLPPDTMRSDPQLLPLANNGGPTLTHALAATSPAIDAGSNSTGSTTDQRGAPFARVRGARADIGAFELQAGAEQPVSIGPGFTGSWFDPNQSGQGITVEVLGNNGFHASWFAFDANGRQAWFNGVGTYSGNTATITQVVKPEGASWFPNFRSADIVAVPWGTLTFTFNDCNHGRVDFASSVAGFGSGHMDLTRLTIPLGLTCP